MLREVNAILRQLQGTSHVSHQALKESCAILYEGFKQTRLSFYLSNTDVLGGWFRSSWNFIVADVSADYPSTWNVSLLVNSCKLRKSCAASLSLHCMSARAVKTHIKSGWGWFGNSFEDHVAVGTNCSLMYEMLINTGMMSSSVALECMLRCEPHHVHTADEQQKPWNTHMFYHFTDLHIDNSWWAIQWTYWAALTSIPSLSDTVRRFSFFLIAF